MKTSPPSRTVRGWVVAAKDGKPFLKTARALRREAIDAYSWYEDWYPGDRRKYGVKAVRCSITTEVEK